MTLFNFSIGIRRAGLKRGNIPDSLNLPFTDLITPNGFFKPKDELKSLSKHVGIVYATILIACSCGSGITVCVVALESLGYMGVVSLYEESCFSILSIVSRCLLLYHQYQIPPKKSNAPDAFKITNKRYDEEVQSEAT